MFIKEDYNKAKDLVINECSSALSAIDFEQTEKYLDLLMQADKVFFVGVGRVFLALECIAFWRCYRFHAGEKEAEQYQRFMAVSC